MSLPIRTDACQLDFLSLGALVHRLDPGVIPFRKARSLDIHVSGGEYNVAANLSDCFGLQDRRRHRDGQLPASASWCRRASARWASRRSTSGSSTTASAGRTSPPSTATAATASAPPVVFYNRVERGRRAAQARRLRLGEDLRRRRPLVPLRRHLRGALRDDVRADHRGDAGRQGGRRDHVVRPELPRQAVGVGRRRQAGRRDACGEIVANVDCLIGNEEDLQKGLGIEGPGGRHEDRVEARPGRVLRHDRPRRRSSSRTSSWWRRRCARSTRPTATTGPRCCGSTASGTSARRASST